MKTTISKWATKAAGAGAIALLLATPAVAQSRGDGYRNQDQRRESRDNNNRNDNNYRDNQRINASGRVSSFSHENNGYRLRLDNDSRSYWVPESSFRGHQLRTGISISLGGVFRGGSIFVDAVNWPDGGYGYRDGNGYNGGWLRGVVQNVDRRDGTLRIRDDRGRIVTAEVNGRYGADELRGLRRGDVVAMSGQWLRSGIFGADRIERR
jgi:hypothetical protein